LTVQVGLSCLVELHGRIQVMRNALVLTGLANFRAVGYTEAIANL